MNKDFSLPITQQWVLAVIAFVLTAFGQPVWHPWVGLISALCGYAIFWRVLLAHSSPKRRFWLATGWFFAVQLVQLSWFVSHPYLYIYSVYSFLSFCMGLQFGIIGLFITPYRFQTYGRLLLIPALWVIFEWSRLFFLSGFSFNPIGLALTGNIYALQTVSLAGIFGLSFWIIFVNLLGVKAWMAFAKGKKIAIAMSVWLIAAAMPYMYGAIHLFVHENAFAKNEHSYFKAMLVQTAFPVEEAADSPAKNNMLAYVLNEWRQILEVTEKYSEESIDLIVLPEFVVPFGTYSFVFPLNKVVQIFHEVFGPESLKSLPQAQWPFSAIQKNSNGMELMVNNAYWVQAIANYFQGDVLAGLEDAEDVAMNEREYYSAALLFHPQDLTKHDRPVEDHVFAERYEKRVLVPMGEYIPFSYFKELAASYGVMGSFTCGKDAKVMKCNEVLISPSICYEETYGHLISEGRKKGAELLVNLTSDVWYPNSRLPRQHFDHARPRTVENGIPLIRACNTGVTSAIDSLGRSVAVLGGDHPEESEWIADALLVDVPLYNYWTPYSLWGDHLLISLCALIIVSGLIMQILVAKTK